MYGKRKEEFSVVSEERIRAYNALMDWTNHDGAIENVARAFAELPEISDNSGLTEAVLEKIARGEVPGFRAEVCRKLVPKGNLWKVTKDE